jgi:hypothetical protein
MALTIGEDVFSALIVSLLLSVFILSLTQAWHARDERLSAIEEFTSAIGVAEQLRDQVLAGSSPGLLEPSAERLDNFTRSRQMNLYVEVRDLSGTTVFIYNQIPNHSAIVSLPAALANSGGSKPCELLVGVW